MIGSGARLGLEVDFYLWEVLGAEKTGSSLAGDTSSFLGKTTLFSTLGSAAANLALGASFLDEAFFGWTAFTASSFLGAALLERP